MRRTLRYIILIGISVFLVCLIWLLLTGLHVIDTGFETNLWHGLATDLPRSTDVLAIKSVRSKYDITESVEIRVHCGTGDLNPEYVNSFQFVVEADGFTVAPNLPLTIDLTSGTYTLQDFHMKKKPLFQHQMDTLPFQFDICLTPNMDTPNSGVIVLRMMINDGVPHIENSIYYYRSENRIYYSTKSIEDAIARGRIVP